jgi:hypothetical protein
VTWLAIQLPEGMIAVWHWDYTNGAPLYTDGCFAPANGTDPVSVDGFDRDLHRIGADGSECSYERDGVDVTGPAAMWTFISQGRQLSGTG